MGRSRSIQIYCRVDIPLITSSLVVLTVCTANVQVLLANNNTKSAGRTTDKDGADSVKILPKVQRYYETYRWTNPDSPNRTYDINYRVEGKPTDPPILLIHGFGGKNNVCKLLNGKQMNGLNFYNLHTRTDGA